VVAVALEDRRQRLAHLQSELAAALQTGGWYEPERRPFRAHVTLARASGKMRLRPIELPPPAPIRFMGSMVGLWRSLPGRGGAHYERLSKVSLRPAR
jgi:2'-5' RNA ligase